MIRNKVSVRENVTECVNSEQCDSKRVMILSKYKPLLICYLAQLRLKTQLIAFIDIL